MTIKRGLNYAEARDYVGVKRRTFDEQWRPRLTPMRQGASLIFDRLELDKLFDEFKAAAAGEGDGDEDQAAGGAAAVGDGSPITQAQNAPRNGRPITTKGATRWATKRPGSTPAKTEPGRSTSGGERIDFATAASLVLRKRSAG